MIRLENIKRQFGPQVLFEGLSWMIPSGSHLGLVGPNGTGKTTLLRILAGLDQPDDGRVHRPQRAQVGYLPQEVETVGGGSVLTVVLEGYREISALERELETTAARMESVAADDPEAARLAETYGVLRHRFEDLDGDRLEARAKTILSGLGVPVERFHDPIETLSGGWRMRVVLARLLLGLPDLLLLDEPTNHLDLDAIAWLEEFLEDYEGALIVVSHDRYFLNRMVRGVVELERGRLLSYAGNYDDYISAREEREAGLEKAAKQQARQIARVERFIERFRYKNTKARQVQSRVRSLEKMERVETTRERRGIRFGFPAPPRSGDIVVRLEGVSKRFGATRVFERADLTIRRGDRVALVGPNGAGKSTLLKLLAGAVPVDEGRLEPGHNVIRSYYAQHQLDALDPGSTALEELEGVAAPGERQRMRNLLGRFLFAATDVDKLVAVLSGGEKARLALAKILVHPANLLLLDEPTNHLDLKSREVLEEALNEYSGTLVVISHDRYFINRVATSIGAVGGGRVELYEGAYDEYAERAPSPGDSESSSEAADASHAVSSRRETKRMEAEERNRRYRERKVVLDRLEPVEAEITRLEQRKRELDELHADPEVYRDGERARAAGRESADVAARLQALYAEWEKIAAAME